MDEIVEVKPGLVGEGWAAELPGETPVQDVRPASFMLILQDDVNDPLNVNIGGTQHPVQFQPGSPAHVIGEWIKNHLEDIIVAARTEHLSQAKPDLVIGPDRERTIVLPAGA